MNVLSGLIVALASTGLAAWYWHLGHDWTT